MKLPAGRVKLLQVFAAAVFVCATAATGLCQTASNVAYAVRDEKGKKTAEIQGDTATVCPDNSLEIINLRMIIFGQDGAEDARLRAAKCFYKVKDGYARSDGNVTIEGKNLLVTGSGFRWNSNDRVVKIMKRARVEIFDLKDFSNYMPVSGDKVQQ